MESGIIGLQHIQDFDTGLKFIVQKKGFVARKLLRKTKEGLTVADLREMLQNKNHSEKIKIIQYYAK